MIDIAILRTGGPPAPLRERFGEYDLMVQRLLGLDTVTAYDAESGELPADAADHGAYIITGSPAGVYDDLPWISPLKDFLRNAQGQAKLVGVCFGHQLMAEAFGGRVEKSERGWGVGLHRYHLGAQAPWMDDGPEVISVPVSHQDQVVVQPPSTTILAASAFTPFAALTYEDQPAISFQFHPEFEPDFTKALIETRRDRLPDPDAALASLDEPDDRRRVAGWLRRFLES
jgi:GMP synthase-like glutamine amidotransferase